MKNIKCSFDFDGTLDRKSIQDYSKVLIEKEYEVWILTSRFGDNKKYQDFLQTSVEIGLDNKDLLEVAKNLGIPEERIFFTNMEDKWVFLKFHGDFLWHLDDDWIENRNILKNTKTKAISSTESNWKNKCERIIEKKLME